MCRRVSWQVKARAAVAAREVLAQGPRARDQVAHQGSVETGGRRESGSALGGRRRGLQHRLRTLQEPRSAAGDPRLARVEQRVDVAEELLEVGSEIAELADGRGRSSAGSESRRTSGSMSRANRSKRSIVARVSRSNVGSTWMVSASASSREASAAKGAVAVYDQSAQSASLRRRGAGHAAGVAYQLCAARVPCSSSGFNSLAPASAKEPGCRASR